MATKTIINLSTVIQRRLASLRHWLFIRWLRRNRARLALLELEGKDLSEFGRQIQRDIRRELNDRIHLR